MRNNEEIRNVKFNLTEKELLEAGSYAADLSSKLTKYEAELKNFFDNMKSKMKIIDLELGITLRKIGDKFEYKDVLVTKEKDFENGVVNYIYNGSIVDSRPFNEEDRQKRIDD